VGLVVGATVGDAIVRLGLDLAAMGGPVLAPGLGAQGATPAVLRETFGASYPRVLATSSREILADGPEAAGVRARAERTLEGLRS
jgi:orotidine-5'-phosphate decarboxylase